MSDESTEKSIDQPKSIPPIVKRFSAKTEGDKVRLTWHVIGDCQVEITGLGVTVVAGSVLVERQPSYIITLNGEDKHEVNLPEETGTTKSQEEEPEKTEEDKNIQRIAYGDGFLIVDGRETSKAEMAHALDGPGKCPKCGVEADAWAPPINNVKFQDLVKTLKDKHGLKTDKEAHELHLRQTGGFISECSECQTSFFVPCSVAKIKSQ